MPMPDFDALIRELHNERFAVFEADVVRKAELKKRAHKNESVRSPRRQAFLKSIGIDPKLVAAEEKGDAKHDGKALDAFLKEARAKVASRKSMRAQDARWAGIRTATLNEASHMVLNPYAASIFSTAADIAELYDGESGTGAINSGWVFPSDPAHIKIKDGGHIATVCFEAYAEGPPPTFTAEFCFVPATTATYDMTAVLAFHGFIVLRSDDGYFSCRHAHARLKVQMNVHQYVDHGWKDFEPVIDRYEENVEEVVSYDHTKFFDYQADLRAGDPVVVTVKGTLDAMGVGGYTYAELNFEAGTANYIWPLFLSVGQL